MSNERDTVLVLTHSADHYVIERVQEELASRGVRSVRCDTDDFPTELQLTARFHGRDELHVLRAASVELDARRVRSVWARKFWTHRLPDTFERPVREGCERESRAALLGWLSALDGVRWVNALEASSRAENKLRQLRVAAALGLQVPRTLVSNAPDAVRAFRGEIGPIVAKMLTPLSISMDRAARFVHTTIVSDADLDHLDGLRFSPMVFQEHVPKQRELRVACVGARCFTGAIDASRSAEGQVDWRRARPDETAWCPAELPPPVAQRLVELVRALGLVYGAADFIVTPAGEHVFLEVNPGGEWGMLERDLDLPIASALAVELLA
jgi:glutathione synthase/RimK-type ligase-like ATP-grasp enzyme